MKLTNTSFSHHKVLTISIIIFAVILLLPIIIIATGKPARVPQRITTQSVTPTDAANPFPNGARTQQGTYSIAYPQNSQNSVNPFAGGSSLVIQPPVGAYPGEPILDVEAYNTKQNLEEKQMWYLAAGAKKSTLFINNRSLPELKVMYKMRTINSKPVHTPTQLRLAYLVEPNALYVFRMYYSSSVSIQTDEDLFTDFIKSFTLR